MSLSWIIDRPLKPAQTLLTYLFQHNREKHGRLSRPSRQRRLAPRLPSLPIDAQVPPSRTMTPVMPRNEATDPPTLVRRAIRLFKLARNLRLILNLEFDGSYPHDFTRVDVSQHRRSCSGFCSPLLSEHHL
jgi:hypothetical protein